MVRLGLRRLKKIKKRTPSGKLKTEYRKAKPSKHHCAICGGELAGMLRGRSIEIQRATKTSRRPTRPFGGQLCSECARKVIALKTKLKLKSIGIDDIPLSLRTYVLGDKTWIKV